VAIIRTGLKAVGRRLFGPLLLGYCDYYRFPEKKNAWGGPLNNQKCRQNIFREIAMRFKPVAIIETGTYVGTTTEFFADTGLPVYSIESDARHYGYAAVRLRKRRNVELHLGDSREGLTHVLNGPLSAQKTSPFFVYLDAHWNESDLPLFEELNIIFSSCPKAIVMIDDFQVPFDPGYAYDDYGPDKSLTLNYIAPVVQTYRLCTYFPAVSAKDETGAKRGCVALASESFRHLFESIPLLRPL
jgi:hypothetical protein